MLMNVRKEGSRQSHLTEDGVEVCIQQGTSLQDSRFVIANNSLEHLVLQSGNKALQNMAYALERQIKEDELQLLSGDSRVDSGQQYQQYEAEIRTLLLPHWPGRERGLKKQVRRSLKLFRRSSGMLSGLLATPARITASACFLVFMNGQPADASLLLGVTPDNKLDFSPVAIKREAQQKEVIFADASLVDLDSLIGGASSQAQLVLLQPSGNLIEQVLDHLLQQGPADRLHLFTHGAPGQLHLGNTIINRTSLLRHSQQLRLVGSLLRGSRDIYLYGCNVAAGLEGREFTNLFSSLTGADVAASDDKTGAGDKGGDWQLELVVGQLDAPPIALTDYTSTLLPSPGHIITGDSSGGGGGGEGGYENAEPSGSGGAGGGSNDILVGTGGDDVIFGDGSGGGGGGGDAYFGNVGSGGKGGGGKDIISGGGGNDILFGDGFDGSDGVYSGGTGGFGGGGGGGGCYVMGYGDYEGGKGGIGGGGGGGSDYADGGDGGYGGGGGGGGGYYGGSSNGGLGGGFNATDGVSSTDDEGGGGGGGGYAGGSGGAGGSVDGYSPGHGGNGGNGTYTSGGGNGGIGGADYGGGGGGGGFGGGTGGNGGTYSAGSPGTDGSITPVTLVDTSFAAYSSVKGMVSTLASLLGGAGHDILDGGPGSDDLFGMGGKNTFVFESDDAGSGMDIDTIYDWNNGSGNKIRVQTGGISLDMHTGIQAMVAAQIPSGDDRSIIHQDGSNKVTIVVKDLGRDLTVNDFTNTSAHYTFPWTMFMPALVKPK